MNLLEDKLSELGQHRPEIPADMRDRCLSTIPTLSKSLKLWPRLAALAAATMLGAAAVFLLPVWHRSGRDSSGAAAFAETVKVMAAVPYLSFRSVGSEQTQFWYDREQGSAMQFRGKYMIDLPTGDHWEIWEAGNDHRAELYHYPASTWHNYVAHIDQLITSPMLSAQGGMHVPIEISRGGASLDGQPVDILIVERQTPHYARTAVYVDPASHRILEERWFDRQANGAYKQSVDFRYDYDARPSPDRFRADRFLKQGYHRSECWVDQSRHVLLSKDGKVIGKM